MPEERLRTCVYRVLRYTPNLVRDEWVNIGVLLYDTNTRLGHARLIEDVNEFARVRRLHPNADEDLLRALHADFEAQFAAHEYDLPKYLDKLDKTLSNALQLSPQKGVLAEDFDAELDRLYRDHVAAPRYRGPAAAANTRAAIRTRANQAFRSAGIWAQLEKRISVDEFTYRGDPLKLDYAYRRNSARGFVHTLALSRDPGQAKVLAFTAESIRAKIQDSEFYAITEIEPQPQTNNRHRFIAGLLAEKEISVVPVSQLEDFANRLRPMIH